MEKYSLMILMKELTLQFIILFPKQVLFKKKIKVCMWITAGEKKEKKKQLHGG
jgi:hypothetical protein